MAATTKTRVVFLAYTRSNNYHLTPTLVKIYAKSSYQKAFNWLSDIADRHGTKVYTASAEQSNVACLVTNPHDGQSWWLERHDVA